jgi:uncharacterized protein
MTTPSDTLTELHTKSRQAIFNAYVGHASFPCVGALSAMNRQRMEFGSYGALGDAEAAGTLCHDLGTFSDKYIDPGTDPVSFVAMFEHTTPNEAEFTAGVWRHLQVMHQVDAARYGWDPAVSSDPSSDDFSFSISGRAFFVVGLSPNSSRLARRAPFPCLVFNFHDQFKQLKSSGKYAGLQKITRQRDVELQGFINPTLARFGDASEARQYAGNVTPANWVCPFKPATSSGTVVSDIANTKTTAAYGN